MSSEINHPTISEGEIIRPTRVEVDLKTLAENFNKIKQHVKDSKIMPVLKANGYGHDKAAR
jgi:alanine racemase